MDPLFFYTVAGIAIFGALGVLLARHPVYAILSLVVTLFALSALFVALNAYFVAVIQILVYAGAVLILFLFVVMLLDITPETLLRSRKPALLIGTGLFGLFFISQAGRVINTFQSEKLSDIQTGVTGTTRAVGEQLFTIYALPFEVASLLLLVGVIGAIVLAKKKL